MPVPQLAQVVRPGSELNEPGRQLAQVVAPVMLPKLPGEHSTHVV